MQQWFSDAVAHQQQDERRLQLSMGAATTEDLGVMLEQSLQPDAYTDGTRIWIRQELVADEERTSTVTTGPRAGHTGEGLPHQLDPDSTNLATAPPAAVAIRRSCGSCPPW